MNEADVARFWSKVDRSDLLGCWPWQAALVHGYGHFWLDGRQRLSHRVIYELHIGAIAPGLEVMHDCDNPACVNPAHLSVGTRLENERGKTERGRRPRGERVKTARLTADVVREIMSSTGSCVRVARQYGITKSHVHRIRKGQTWAHVERPAA